MSNAPTQKYTFVDLCLSQKADPREIGKFIDAWHHHHYMREEPKDMLRLSEYLGLTPTEYSSWLQGTAFEEIVYGREPPTLKSPEAPTGRCESVEEVLSTTLEVGLTAI
jgi:hypothetical protein